MVSQASHMDGYDKIVAATRDGLSEPVVEPYWSIDLKDDAKILGWLSRAIEATEMNTLIRMERQLVNRFARRGIQWEDQDPYGFHTNDRKDIVSSDKISVPDQYRYVENTTPRLTRFKAATHVGPSTNEFGDKQGARVVKMFLDYVKTQLNLDDIDRKVIRRLPTDGEAYQLVTWDDKGGPITKRWKDANKKFGNKKNRLGDWEYDPKKPERLGELKVKVTVPWRWRFDSSASEPANCEYAFYIEHLHVKKIVNMFPKMEAQIEAAAEDHDFIRLRNMDASTAQDKSDPDVVPYIRMWHKSHDALPNGAYIQFIPGLLLKKEDNPYAGLELLEETIWGELPIESMTDLDIEDHLHGFPTLTLIESFSRARNQILTAINRNVKLHGTPKLLVHRNADVDIEATTSALIKWSGQVAPELKNFDIISAEIVGFYQMLGEELERAVNMHPISSGTPPKGITAGVALRLLEEIEDKLFEPQVKKLNNMVISRDRRLTALAGKFYKKEDGRMMHIVGEDNSDIIKELDVESLTKKYNYRFEPVAAQSKSAASRKQDVIDTLQYGPEGVLTREQILDALELNRPEKITDPAQTAVANAERVVEKAASGDPLPHPRRGENYIVKWNILLAYYQRAGFTQLPEDKQQEFVDNITFLEFLMDEQALKSPMYNQTLMQIPHWPAFYNPSPRPVTNQDIQEQQNIENTSPERLKAAEEQKLTNEQIAQGG